MPSSLDRHWGLPKWVQRLERTYWGAPLDWVLRHCGPFSTALWWHRVLEVDMKFLSHSLPSCLVPSIKANCRYSLGWEETQGFGGTWGKRFLEVNWSPFSLTLEDSSCPLFLIPQDINQGQAMH